MTPISIEAGACQWGALWAVCVTGRPARLTIHGERVVLWPERGSWVALGADLDISAQGPNPIEAAVRWGGALVAEMLEAAQGAPWPGPAPMWAGLAWLAADGA